MSEVSQELDARGLNCPLPILRAKKAIAGMAEGDVLKILATDPGAVMAEPRSDRRPQGRLRSAAKA